MGENKRLHRKVMLKKLLLIFAVLFAPIALGFTPSHAAQMVNVEYIHKLIEREWGIKIPYNPNLKNPKVAANMKYLLTTIDVANQTLNGTKTTDYGNNEKYANKLAADTVATNKAVATLIRVKPEFTITTTADTKHFEFKMSAAGTFAIDWGDGTGRKIVRKNTTLTTYSHDYKNAGEYVIRIAGRATEYSTNYGTSVIYFSGTKDAPNRTIAGISGSLGAIFPTIGDGSASGQQPKYWNTFANCVDMQGEIPPDLLTGVKGHFLTYMFANMFENCAGLTGKIPATLFAGMNGAPTPYMFHNTFRGCSGLTGAIPAGLFGNISGDAAPNMFYGTFSGCSGLTGSIPAGLFGNLTGAPAPSMFCSTFYDCSGLFGEIPAGLFGNISGAPAGSMFMGTFQGCSNLSGSIPATLFAGIRGAPAPYMFYGTFNGCSNLSGEIPADLFAGVDGAPAENMFLSTFANCHGLSGAIPAGLFGKLRGAPAPNMFYYTFFECRGLWGCVPDGLFSDIDATLDEIIATNYTFNHTDLAQAYCSTLEPVFYVTTSDDITQFKFNISAKGNFMIDWGDGTREYLGRTNTTSDTPYSHDYETADTYTIGIGGLATGYHTSSTVAAIRFGGSLSTHNTTVAGISGSLGAIFPTIGDGSVNGRQPRFRDTFAYCDNLAGEIPENLFTGISGKPTTGMFENTFGGSAKLSGSIPATLFGDLDGAPAPNMFLYTFDGCRGLSGAIPAGLFAGISGKPAPSMFSYTFRYCTGLTGEIPGNLFGGISGEPAQNMFGYTFQGCKGLAGPIPGELFAGLDGAPAENMFNFTFQGCVGLSGDVPAGLFGKLRGAPAKNMFLNTFYSCTGLSGCIPDDWFADIDATLDEILNTSGMISVTGIRHELCPATD